MHERVCYQERSISLNRLQRVLTVFEVEHLNMEEIAYLQLFYMEGLAVADIAQLLECEVSEIRTLENRFSV